MNMDDVSLSFPRSFGRGLIEAPALSVELRRSRRFPRSFGRGLIEASRWHPRPGVCFPGFRDLLVAASLKRSSLHCHCQLTTEFPRSFGRGLIEASSIGLFNTGVPGFRDLLVAASLKPVWSETSIASTSSFRDLLVAASLKLRLPGICQPIGNVCFRDLLVAASLKPGSPTTPRGSGSSGFCPGPGASPGSRFSGCGCDLLGRYRDRHEFLLAVDEVEAESGNARSTGI